MYSNKAKRRILSLSIIILMLSVLSYGTYAFFTSDDIATNVITTGSIDIKLVEQSDDGSGILRPFENVMGVMPGEEVSKIVSITNTGNNTAWVRIKLDKSLSYADGEAVESPHTLLELDYNTADWTYVNGFWYYLQPLQAGASTAPLFTAVRFSGTGMGNEFQNSVAVIGVLAQATQYNNNGTTVYDAMGWSVVEEY
ncbi:MAG: hypothetical protein IJB65_02450 [Clostridia bacterium]|nr:hypothetical protein [Clostridia bacterium]